VEERGISQAVIGRLPRYYRYLGDLKGQGVERISSQELSRIMNVTASQIRQDFNNFGGFGQQGYGYNTSYLYDEIGKILGLNKQHDMILIGAGKLGQALVNYMNLKNRGFSFKGAFDVNPSLYNKKIANVPVYPMEQMPDFIRENNIDIAVLTVPRAAAIEITQVLTGTPIKAIWNFAHVDLNVPDRIQVESVHLQDSLMKLSYNIRCHEDEN
jgi:redox-sensing transcriptional repressor